MKRKKTKTREESMAKMTISSLAPSFSIICCRVSFLSAANASSSHASEKGRHKDWKNAAGTRFWF